MADEPIDRLRLSLMQDVLPVGMAMVKRARKGGASKVAEAFTSLDDPLQALRTEGEPAAKTLREQLDKLSPGLGNPVVPVKVDVELTNPKVEPTLDLDHDSLNQCLERIQVGVNELETLLFDDCSEQRTSRFE